MFNFLPSYSKIPQKTLVIALLILAYPVAHLVLRLFEVVFPATNDLVFLSNRGRFYLVALIPTFIFFLTGTMRAIGKEKNQWFIPAYCVPTLGIMFLFDSQITHWFFYLAFPLAGWLIGIWIKKIRSRIKVQP